MTANNRRHNFRALSVILFFGVLGVGARGGGQPLYPRASFGHRLRFRLVNRNRAATRARAAIAPAVSDQYHLRKPINSAEVPCWRSRDPSGSAAPTSAMDLRAITGIRFLGETRSRCRVGSLRTHLE